MQPTNVYQSTPFNFGIEETKEPGRESVKGRFKQAASTEEIEHF